MTATSRFFDRATVQRNSETDTDAHGHPLPPVWASHLTLSCRVYNNKDRFVVDGDKSANVNTLRIAYAIGTDITDEDRITAINDRQGNSKYTGNYEIRQPARKYDHMEADLRLIE